MKNHAKRLTLLIGTGLPYVLPIVLSLTLLTLGQLMGSGCKVSKVQAPQRPDSVPKDAFWSGGPDGGSWFRCDSFQIDSGLYWLSIYNEGDGQIWEKGPFVLKGKPISPDSLGRVIAGYDGDRVHLVDHRFMVPGDSVDRKKQ
jgi:hypothetical protein